MFAKGKKSGTVRFLFSPARAAQKVFLAGDFNDWKPAAMKKQQNGGYAITVNLKAGAYEYKFVIDSEWVVDPDNSAWALNPYGTVNSVAVIQ